MNASLTVADWQRLNGLLAIVLDLEVEARTQWLESLGAEDRHLRPVLVDLLAQADMTGFAAETSPPTSVARMASAAISAMRREQAGDRIGPWQLERLLAEGGMGAVWVAQRADGVMKRHRGAEAAARRVGRSWVKPAPGARAGDPGAAAASAHRSAVRCRAGRRRPALSGARVRRWRADRCVLPGP